MRTVIWDNYPYFLSIFPHSEMRTDATEAKILSFREFKDYKCGQYEVVDVEMIIFIMSTFVQKISYNIFICQSLT